MPTPQPTSTRKREYNRRYYLEHREQIIKQNNEYRVNHREKVRESLRRWGLNNRARKLELNRAYRKRHPERERKRHQAYRQAHPEKYLKSILKWRKANPEKTRLAQRRFDQSEKGRNKHRAFKAKKRAQKREAKGSFTRKDIADLLENQGSKCAICKKAFPPEGSPNRYHVDHIIPLSRGGPNSIDNIQLLHPRCHQKKEKFQSKRAN